MIEDLGEMHTPNPDEPGEFADSLGERVLVLRHDNIVVSHTILSRGNAIENEWSLAQIGDMNQWPQRQFGVFCCPSKKSLARCRMRYYIVGASPRSLP